MNAQENGSKVIAKQIRAMRNALGTAKQAVHEWRRQSGARAERAFGMLVLLGTTVSDNDGEETLDVVASFFEEYGGHLATLGDRTSLELADAIRRLGTEAVKLDTIRSFDADTQDDN